MRKVPSEIMNQTMNENSNPNLIPKEAFIAEDTTGVQRLNKSGVLIERELPSIA
jgi:hypothetical protein